MLRRPSPLLRVQRALTALIAVWCLGCSGFEPLLSALLAPGATPEMSCEAEIPSSGPSVAPTGSDADRDFDCGCGHSCQAVSFSLPTVGQRPAPMPRVVAADLAQPASIVRSPLLPPPQRVA